LVIVWKWGREKKNWWRSVLGVPNEVSPESVELVKKSLDNMECISMTVFRITSHLGIMICGCVVNKDKKRARGPHRNVAGGVGGNGWEWVGMSGNRWEWVGMGWDRFGNGLG
jgi:hypothetical protein